MRSIVRTAETLIKALAACDPGRISGSEAVEGLPATREVFTAGRISEAQAAEVAKAAAVDPSAETDLLQTAEHDDWRSLKDQARRVRLNAEVDRQALHARQHRAREFHHWIDDEGMVAGRFRLPPEVGAPLVNRIDRPHRPRIQEGLAAGRPRVMGRLRLRRPLGAALALRRWWQSVAAHVVVVIDLDALRRGHTHDGERSHIPGVGPLPVAVARRIASDAFLKGVLIDGCEIRKVKHFGRHIPAEVRTALQLGAAPELDGGTCVEEGCGRAKGWNGTMTTPSPTAAPPPTTTSKPAAAPTTATRPNAIAKPA